MEGKSSRQDSSSLRERILAASGEKRAGLVLKGARVVNVFTGELEEADVAIEGGYIAGVGSYEGETDTVCFALHFAHLCIVVVISKEVEGIGSIS